MMELYTAIRCLSNARFVCSVYNCVGVTMEFYHDVLVSNVVLNCKAYAIVGVDISQRFIPDVHFTRLDARD